ncbi:MAG TPA: DUF5683 domain-containing protein [Puia sp.]|nr:DUF5683 domain-containing protein [Puia sp.]
MKTVRYLFMVCVLLWLQSICYGQVKKDTLPPYIKGKVVLGERVLDTLPPNADSLRGRKKGRESRKADTAATVKKKHDPHKATLYSTFCPGLGQIYNHKYWKLPLVYAAVGIPVYTYFYNRDWYKKCQYALALVVSGDTSAASLGKVDPQLKLFVTEKNDASLRTYRNEFRKDQDYSVIFFLLFWGLQIVDATVDAHLMNFDISPELSLHLRDGSGSLGNPLLPGVANTTGIGLAFDLHKARYKPIPLP